MISPIRDNSVRLISCSRALTRSGLSDVDYALNPYHGCAHGCLYCYAPDVLRCKRGMDWGKWVEARVNISRRLKKEIKEIGKAVIGISTVTDPYQPIEEKLGLTRACLEVISESDASIMIMTKSPLALRDIDLIASIRNAEICVTVTTVNEKISSIFESRVAVPRMRFDVLARFAREGIKTSLMVSPLLLSQEDPMREIEQFIEIAESIGCDGITFDRLRLRDIGRERIREHYGGTELEDEVRNVVSRSESINLEQIATSILRNTRFSMSRTNVSVAFGTSWRPSLRQSN